MPHGIKDRYLGDGVYASFDGFQIWLAANHHTNKVIAIEPEVLGTLVEYAAEIAEAQRKERERAADLLRSKESPTTIGEYRALERRDMDPDEPEDN